MPLLYWIAKARRASFSFFFLFFPIAAFTGALNLNLLVGENEEEDEEIRQVSCGNDQRVTKKTTE